MDRLATSMWLAFRPPLAFAFAILQTQSGSTAANRGGPGTTTVLFGLQPHRTVQADRFAVQVAVGQDERHGRREFFRFAEP